ncbi:MAG: accessory factor UbiK family protein [Pseudomonadota bacterium]
MQTRSTLLDDLSQLMTNAAGMAQGMRSEAETAMRGLAERFIAENDLVTREEFEAVREMAVKAREENDALKARLAALEAGQAGETPSEG